MRHDLPALRAQVHAAVCARQREAEARITRAALRATGGHVADTAALLGVSTETLRLRLRELGIAPHPTGSSARETRVRARVLRAALRQLEARQ